MADVLLMIAEHPAAPTVLRLEALRALTAAGGLASVQAVTAPDVPLGEARAVCPPEAPWWLAHPDATVDDAIEHATAGHVSAAVGALQWYRGPYVAQVCAAAVSAHPSSARVAKAVVRAGATCDLDHAVAAQAAERAVRAAQVTALDRSAVLDLVRARYRAGDPDAADLADRLAALPTDSRLSHDLTVLAGHLRHRPAPGGPGWLTHPDTTPQEALAWVRGSRKATQWRAVVLAHPVADVIDAALDQCPKLTVVRAILDTVGHGTDHPAQVLRALSAFPDLAYRRVGAYMLRRALRTAAVADAAAFVAAHPHADVTGLTHRDLTAGELEMLHVAVTSGHPARPVPGLLAWARAVLVHPLTPAGLRADAADLYVAVNGSRPDVVDPRTALTLGPALGEELPLSDLTRDRWGALGTVLLRHDMTKRLPLVRDAATASVLCALAPTFTGSLRELVDTAVTIAS